MVDWSDDEGADNDYIMPSTFHGHHNMANMRRRPQFPPLDRGKDWTEKHGNVDDYIIEDEDADGEEDSDEEDNNPEYDDKDEDSTPDSDEQKDKKQEPPRNKVRERAEKRGSDDEQKNKKPRRPAAPRPNEGMEMMEEHGSEPAAPPLKKGGEMMGKSGSDDGQKDQMRGRPAAPPLNKGNKRVEKRNKDHARGYRYYGVVKMPYAAPTYTNPAYAGKEEPKVIFKPGQNTDMDMVDWGDGEDMGNDYPVRQYQGRRRPQFPPLNRGRNRAQNRGNDDH